MRDRVFGYNDKEEYSPRELNRISLATLEQKLAAVRKANAEGAFVREAAFGSTIDLDAIERQQTPADEGGFGALDAGDDMRSSDEFSQVGADPAADALHDAFEALLNPATTEDEVRDIVYGLRHEDLEALKAPRLQDALRNHMPEESFAILKEAMDEAAEIPAAGEDYDPTSVLDGYGEFDGNDELDDLEMDEFDEGDDYGYSNEQFAADDSRKRFAGKSSNRKRNVPNSKKTSPRNEEGNKRVKQTPPRDGGDVPKVKQPVVAADVLPQRRDGKIVFTDPIQMSSRACFAAAETGNESVRRTIIAARHARRMQAVQEYKQLDEAKREAEAKAARVAQARKASTTKENTTEVNGFKSPTEFNSREKRAFSAICANLDIPKEFVAAQCVRTAGKSAAFLGEIKAIAESNLSKAVKTAAVRELVKTAANDQAAMKDAYNYWAQFYDKEWAKALFLDAPKQGS
jgi:hypothetical protein